MELRLMGLDPADDWYVRRMPERHDVKMAVLTNWLDEQDVRHGHERGHTTHHLGADVGPVLTQLEEKLEHDRYPAARGLLGVQIDDPFDGPAADRTETDLVPREHDAVGAGPVEALGLGGRGQRQSEFCEFGVGRHRGSPAKPQAATSCRAT